MITQAPGLPDPASLKDLPEGVAYAVLVTAVILALLFYFGAPLRDRLTKKPPPPLAPPASSSATPVQDGPGQHALTPPPVATAVDKAEARTDQFIDTLLRQIAAAANRETELEREMERLRRELELARQEYQRLMWQRGAQS